MTRRRLIGWAAGLSALVALVLVDVVHVVIDSTADEALAERVEGYTLWVTSLAGVLMVLLATGLAAWASRRALAPVGQMAAVAADWSEHDLSRRFELGPPTDEIRALGSTLDGLLDKVAQAIGGEQRLTSELAHELRTPLTTIQATADLMASRADLDAELREDVADIQQACHTMGATMSGLLELARRPGESSTSTLSEVIRLTGHQVALATPPQLTIALPAALAARALAPVLDNAAKHASSVSLAARKVDGLVEISVADDGPGVHAEDSEAIFTPGWSDGGGSGLGLSLARRIARSAGGDVRLAPSARGATFVVTLPAAWPS